jgi:hypothetical protein
MLDFFFIIIVVIVLGLFGGLLYLVYLPFKNRLKKSGKLTDKLNRQINWTFILLLCLAGVVLYCLKDYRTSSKHRPEEISDVKLPTGFKVLKDEYQDMLQDYCILYDIQFDNSGTTELVENIKTSKFYNENVLHTGVSTENDFNSVDSVKAVWYKSPKGFDFSRQDGRTSYHIKFDTVTNILNYNECAD